MKAILCAAAALLLWTSCKKTETSNGCLPDTRDYSFQYNKILDTIRGGGTFGPFDFYQIQPGDRLVFKYTLSTGNCPNLLDAGLTTQVVFQIPQGLTSFRFSDSASLRNAHVWLQNICYGCSGGHFIKAGVLEGNLMLTGEWHVKGSFAQPDGGGSFEGNFSLR